MATATLTNTPTVLDNAESTTDWNGDSFDLEPDIKVQGSNSVATLMTNNGTNDIYVDGFTAADMDNVHLRLWFNCAFVGYLASTNAIQVFISDGSNTAYWTVIGSSAEYTGGWKNVVVYTGNTPTSGTKPTGNTSRVGMRFNTSSKPRNQPANVWFDAWYYGDGFTATGGATGDGNGITWSDIATADATSAYGVVSEVDGVIFIAGDIKIGNGSTTTYFEDDGDIAVFKDLSVNSTLYNIEFVDTATGYTNVDIDGGTYSAAGSQNFTFDASDTDINSFSLVGKQIANAGLIKFAAGQTIDNTVFVNCDQIDPSTSTFELNTITNYTGTDGALLYPTTTTNISDITLINCDDGVECDTATTYAMLNMVFTDCTNDINNTSGGAVTINASGTSNPTTETGDTTINNTKSLTLTGLISGSEVRAYVGTDPDTSVAVDGVESSGTSFVISHQEGGNDGYIQIHKEDYESKTIWLTYPSSDGSIPIQQDFDRNYRNP